MNDLGTITLETERLILRKFKIEDAEAMYNNWATDPECNKYLSWDLHKNIEETINRINNETNYALFINKSGFLVISYLVKTTQVDYNDVIIFN